MTEQWLTAREVWTLLGIKKTAFYAIPFFRTKKHFPTQGGGAVRYASSDVAVYQRTRSYRRAA